MLVVTGKSGFRNSIGVRCYHRLNFFIKLWNLITHGNTYNYVFLSSVNFCNKKWMEKGIEQTVIVCSFWFPEAGSATEASRVGICPA